MEPIFIIWELIYIILEKLLIYRTNNVISAAMSPAFLIKIKQIGIALNNWDTLLRPWSGVHTISLFQSFESVLMSVQFLHVIYTYR